MGFKKKIFENKKLIAVSIGFVLLLYSFSLIDFEKFFEIILQANLLVLLFIYPVSFVSIFLKSFKFKTILNALREDYNLISLAKIFTVGFFTGILTPGRVGDFSRAFYLRDKIPLVKGSLAVFLDRVIDVFVLLVFSFISILMFFLFFKKMIFPIELIFLLLAVLVLGILFVFNLKKMEFISRFFFRFAPERFKEFIKNTCHKFNEATFLVKNDFPKVIFALVVGFVGWSINFLIGLILLHAFSIDVPFYFIFLLMPIISLVEVVPVSIAGLGTREVATIFLFSFYSVPAEYAVAFSLTFFLLLYPVIALTGFYYSVRLKTDFSNKKA